MRKPKQPGTKQIADENPPPGGRAWQRVKQFAIERGLPLPAEPSEKKVEPDAKPATKRRAKRVTKKSERLKRRK